MPVRLVLADDHPIVLAGLDQLCRDHGLTVVARCRSGEEALVEVRRQRPDVLVLDLRMPGLSGLDVLRALKAEALPTRVVLLTAAIADDQVVEAVRLGVAGVTLKDASPAALVACVRTVHRGGRSIGQDLLDRALTAQLRREDGEREVAAALTPRERDIVRMVAAGLRNRQIGDQLGISEGTVKIHLHHIYEKLRVTSRLELALYARQRGLGPDISSR